MEKKLTDSVEVWCVQDKDGILRPQAGIWVNKNYGEDNAREYADKHKKYGNTVVLCDVIKK